MRRFVLDCALSCHQFAFQGLVKGIVYLLAVLWLSAGFCLEFRHYFVGNYFLLHSAGFQLFFVHFTEILQFDGMLVRNETSFVVELLSDGFEVHRHVALTQTRTYAVLKVSWRFRQHVREQISASLFVKYRGNYFFFLSCRLQLRKLVLIEAG